MKIQVLSDLHLEGGIHPMLKKFEPIGDVVVLTGDICSSKTKRLVDEVFGKCEVPVIYVLGNHEYYGGVWDRTPEDFRDWFVTHKDNNIILLDDDYFTFQGVRFFGSTWWCDPIPSEELAIKQMINDYRMIVGCTVQEQRREHDFSKAWMEMQVKRAKEDPEVKKTVCITHFPPSYQAQEERFKMSPLGSYFYNNDEDLVLDLEPDLWIYGHTHGNLRFKIGETPVVTNQLGYFREPSNNTFFINYVVEV